ncbi:FAD-dependent monooxygenase [Nocardia carnea]|uniref:FAD-dependent monooxygenase n=1 Tax=Nocardia carnea TaxID=37328 RepID=UPI0024565616|nr:FAD-dependent monooxygenase [Nocardia carnea]
MARSGNTAARGRAVVLGASMGGLLAARVLAEHFAEVVVLERDDLSAPGDRRGVPQGRHVHALLARGRLVLEELFPGITAELLADGAVECRSLTEMRMTVAGHTLRQADAGYSLLQAGRPFLEWRVRGRVRALPGVELVDNTAVAGLLADTGRARVTGVRTTDGREFDADLVVSCLGRHGPINEWLTGLGYERPAEHGVRIDMKYASRYVRLPPRSAGGDKEIVIANQNPARGLALFAVEDGAHILTLIGYGRDHPPTDPDGFWRFAASVAPRDVREALVGAEVLSDIATYRYPANQRRRYEQLTRFPDGLLVLGDAVCSFSPAFGQGMTVSALQAQQLGEALTAGDHDLRRRYFRAVARAIDDAWRITELFDLAMPHVDSAGREPLRALGALAGVAMAVGERDAAIATRIARVAGLLDRPETLLRPEPAGRAALAVGTLAATAVLRLPRNRNPRPAPLFDPLPHGPARGFHRLVVRSVVRDTEDSAIVEFDIPAHLRSRFAYAAGQHLVIRGTRRGEPDRLSYSLCDPPAAGRVRIAVKRQAGGAFSSYVLDERITGSALYVSEPSGVFTPELDPAARTEYAAVAAGSGITPIISIIAAVLGAEPDSTFTLYYGSRDRANIMLAQSLRELRDRYPGRLRVVHHLSRQRPRTAQDAGSHYRYGRLAAADIARQHADRWFLCGPKELVTETVDALRTRGVPGSRIRVELFDTRTPDRPRTAAGAATSRITLTGYGEPLQFGMPRDRAILDAALDEREDLPYSCLGGSCGTCLAVVVDGQAEMDPDPLLAITGDDIARGRVLACRARPVTEQVTLCFGPGPADEPRTPESAPGRSRTSP